MRTRVLTYGHRSELVVRARILPTVRPKITFGQLRQISSTSLRSNVPTWPNPPIPQGPVGPSDDLTSGSQRNGGNKQESHRRWYQDWVHSPSFQAALTTVVGLGMVFGAGVGYLQWYKSHVLARVS